LLALVMMGIGPLVGSNIAGAVFLMGSRPGGHDWTFIWLVPAALSAVVLCTFAALFRAGPRKTSAEAEASGDMAEPTRSLPI
jgi:hypothetical protein